MAATTFSVDGQASADHGLTTNSTAIADLTVSYDIPYTVTRTATVSTTGTNSVSFETFDVDFSFIYDHNTAHDNSQVGGGLANALANGASVTSLGGLFSAYSPGGSSSGGGGIETGASISYSMSTTG